ncbi:MAG: hypothetical protein DHS20C19_00770 [Acidimicrobiales bacterium]|nr:MAG: hypothetical protein DHS20C19_00770 [Acidimicrobiales bacterium]
MAAVVVDDARDTPTRARLLGGCCRPGEHVLHGIRSNSWVRLLVDPAMRAPGLRRSFRFAALQGLHLAPPANSARLDGSTAEPRIEPGTDQRASLVGEVGARPLHSEATAARSHPMHIPHIATRFIDRTDPRPGDVHIGHPYRRLWWLPVGPTATVLLDHLAAEPSDAWMVHNTLELGTTIGLGKGTGIQSPLIRTFSRLDRFGFGTFDIEPSHPDSDPCISLWSSVGLVPERITRQWPMSMQQAHAVDLAALHRAAA